MKVKYMICASVALLLASCDLDKDMQGQYVSDSQKEEEIEYLRYDFAARRSGPQ